MACRVGITTDPNRRKREWETQYPTLRNWMIMGQYNTKSEAQKRENEVALLYGCVSAPGGAGNEYDTWYVYKFDY